MTSRFAAPASLAVALALCCPPAGSAAAAAAALPSAPGPSAAVPAGAVAAAAGVSREDMEPRVDACVDFYRYACGGWMANHPVPPDQRAWNRFAALTDANRAKLRDILSADAAPAGAADRAGGDRARASDPRLASPDGRAAATPLRGDQRHRLDEHALRAGRGA